MRGGNIGLVISIKEKSKEILKILHFWALLQLMLKRLII